ncbi:hypothetical protein DID88_004745 [Monilinia fructigena]|uniref:GIY-YIG domain-containing protein n=1 Tax=Monilinia fructigena TaxID=38457 RepID=A0A395ISS2_9HELO|nr:hypothetical protein DID88_004745 [Monilinia fructigena]
MSCIVTGFPSSIAALQFEWAWQNPHITLHIPPSSRISYSTQKKRSGHPRRPTPSIQSALSNLKLLLSVPSFSRWPLEVRFFAPDVHKAWTKWSQKIGEPLRDSLPIITDFPPGSKVHEEASENHGINSLHITHEKTKPHLEKGKQIFHPDMHDSCTICKQTLLQDSGLYTICPNVVEGKEGEGQGVAVSQVVVGSDDEEEDEDEEDQDEEEEEEEDDDDDEKEEEDEKEQENRFKAYLDSEDSDTISTLSTSSNKSRTRKKTDVATTSKLITVIKDSDGEDGEE